MNPVFSSLNRPAGCQYASYTLLRSVWNSHTKQAHQFAESAKRLSANSQTDWNEQVTGVCGYFSLRARIQFAICESYIGCPQTELKRKAGQISTLCDVSSNWAMNVSHSTRSAAHAVRICL